MTERRFTLEPPLASANTWVGRQAPAFGLTEVVTPIALETAVTPLAEHVVLDCLRALKVIAPSPYAMDLTDMISRGFLEIPGQTARMRRIAALLEISAEEPAP